MVLFIPTEMLGSHTATCDHVVLVKLYLYFVLFFAISYAELSELLYGLTHNLLRKILNYITSHEVY